MTATAESRYCPVCGLDAEARFCPRDGTATVVRKTLVAEAIDYVSGHVLDGRYRITGRIGRGGFGSVYAAVHTGTGQDVALKVLHVDLSSDNASTVRRFWQEAQITARLHHANTVRVFDVGQTEEGAFYLAMERLRGRTLAEVLEERARAGRTLGEAETLDLAIEVLKSLQEAHRAGLVHRDLKPANVMVCEGDEDGAQAIKVLDFGIARTADSSLTRTGAALGTPAYMSPEQCAGQPLDARSDLYALGAVMFRCVAGRPPFVDENPLSVMFQHAQAPPPDPRTAAAQSLSDAFARCVLQSLAKKPADRFEDARRMREALEAARTGVAPVDDGPTEMMDPADLPFALHADVTAAAPLTASAPGRRPPEPAQAPGRRTGLWIGVAVALAAATGAWTWAGRGASEPVVADPLEAAPAGSPDAAQPGQAEPPRVAVATPAPVTPSAAERPPAVAKPEPKAEPSPAVRAAPRPPQATKDVREGRTGTRPPARARPAAEGEREPPFKLPAERPAASAPPATPAPQPAPGPTTPPPIAKPEPEPTPAPIPAPAPKPRPVVERPIALD